MSQDRKYTQDEVNAILKRALERRDLLPEHVPHGELVETAREIGIAPADLEHAIVEEKRERALRAEREEWIDRRKARLKQGTITWMSVNAICLAINLLAGGPLWFFWVLVPWAIVLLAQAARLRNGPSGEQIERERVQRERRLRRAEQREQLRHGAQVLEAVVEQGVNALVTRLEEHRRRLGPPASRDGKREPSDPKDR